MLELKLETEDDDEEVVFLFATLLLCRAGAFTVL